MNSNQKADRNTFLSIALISLFAATFAISCDPRNPFYQATKTMHEWGQALMEHLPPSPPERPMTTEPEPWK